MDVTRDDAERWLTRYGEAWERRSPELASALFSEDCRYYETPFDEPAVGRAGVLEYWKAVPQGQRDIAFRHRVLAVQSRTVIAHWSASFTRIAGGQRVELDGVFVLEFAADGLCTSLREWWHREEAAPKPWQPASVTGRAETTCAGLRLRFRSDRGLRPER